MSRVESTLQPVIRGAQHCPVCGLPYEQIHQQAESSGVRSVTLLCGLDHLWNVRWPVVT